MRALIKTIFFGNYFYGICAMLLSVEAMLQQQIPLNNAGYFIVVSLLTVVYYTKAYLTAGSFESTNPRTQWYVHNKTFTRYSQLVFIITCVTAIVFFLIKYRQEIIQASWLQWLLAIIFPVAAALYYGMDNGSFGGYNLRKIGWLKPFLIGFVWAGLVTVYPVLYYSVTQQTAYPTAIIGGLLFLKNFMFIAVLSMMFDIKDYAADSNHQLKTFVVRTGLRKTIFFIIIPLTVLGLGSFIVYGIQHHFSLGKLLLNSIPFILMIAFAYSLHRRKSILFYLIIIDGLMLVKAVCGILAMKYF
jgi:UbiA prenyltransferase family